MLQRLSFPHPYSAYEIPCNTLLCIPEIEESFDMPPYKTPSVISVRRLQQIFQIYRPGGILPDVAPWLVQRPHKMPNHNILSQRTIFATKTIPPLINLKNPIAKSDVNYILIRPCNAARVFCGVLHENARTVF